MPLKLTERSGDEMQVEDSFDKDDDLNICIDNESLLESFEIYLSRSNVEQLYAHLGWLLDK